MTEINKKLEKFSSKGNVKAYMSGASSVVKSCAEKAPKKHRKLEPISGKFLTTYIMGVVLTPAVISATAAGYGLAVATAAAGAAVIYGASRLIKDAKTAKASKKVPLRNIQCKSR